jgi:hypothetical protein
MISSTLMQSATLRRNTPRRINFAAIQKSSLTADNTRKTTHEETLQTSGIVMRDNGTSDKTSDRDKNHQDTTVPSNCPKHYSQVIAKRI